MKTDSGESDDRTFVRAGPNSEACKPTGKESKMSHELLLFCFNHQTNFCLLTTSYIFSLQRVLGI